MRSFRILLAAILLTSCPWYHLRAQNPGQAPATPPVPSKTPPVAVQPLPTPAATTTAILPAGFYDASYFTNGVPANIANNDRPPTYPGPFSVWTTRWKDVPHELAIADSLRFYGVEPVLIENPGSIKKIAPEDERFKWVLTTERKLWAIPILDLKRPSAPTNANKDMYKDDIIKHVIVTRGTPVLSAGEARLKGSILVIDNGSGHYQPTELSLQHAVDAFEKAGFDRKNIATHDFIRDKHMNYFK